MKNVMILFLSTLVFACNNVPNDALAKEQEEKKAVSDTAWKRLAKDNYSIDYPNDWDPDLTGQMGTNFFLFSKMQGDSDAFRENVNLIVQDLSGRNMDLAAYSKISEDQINKIITNSELVESSGHEKNGQPFHKMIYIGDQGQFRLEYEQYYFVKDEKAYVLTFTTEQKKYRDYAAVAERILNSFQLN